MALLPSVPAGAAASPTEAALRSAYAAGVGLPTSAVGALRAGSLRLATVDAPAAQWAVATFLPAGRASAPHAWAFQGGRGRGVFTRPAGGTWRLVRSGGRALPCVVGLPRAVREAWGLPPLSACARERSDSASAGVAAAALGRDGPIPQRVAAIALSQVGVRGTPVAHDFGHDCNPYTPMVGPTIPNSDGCGYDRTFRVRDQSEAWCADFTKWVWHQAGVTGGLNTINAGASSFYGWAHDDGQRMTVNPTDPSVGDAVVFFPPGPISANVSADHVGIVTAVHPDGTIDLVNGDFQDPVTNEISVEYDTGVDLATWAPSVWGSGEQWVFVTPPQAARDPAPAITTLEGPAQAVAGTEVGFRARAAMPDGSIASYVWAFGDGGSATGARVRHVFRNAGRQTVSVTATSNRDTVSTRRLTIQVTSSASTVANTAAGSAPYTTQPVRQQLFGLSSTGALTVHESLTAGPWSVSVLPGTPAPGSAVTALNYPGAGDRMIAHVLFRGADGALHQTTGHGTDWSTATIGGRLAATSPIVGALTAKRGALTPHVFAIDTAGRLVEAVERRSRWSIRPLPGAPAAGTSLAATVVVRRGAAQVHVFFIDGRGRLRDAVYTRGRWSTRVVGGGRPPAPTSALTAAAFGPGGRVAHVFYLDRGGALVDARSSGRRWTARVLPGSPAPSSRLMAQTYLPTAVTAASSRLSLGVFYLSRRGDPAQTSFAPMVSRTPRWAATTLGGTGDALLGVSAYPDGVQGQQVFYRSGETLYDNAYTPVNGAWYPAAMPGRVAADARR